MDVATLIKIHSGMHDLTTFDGAKSQLFAHLDTFIAAHDYVTVTAPPTTEEHMAWDTTVPFDVHFLLNGEVSERQSSLASFIAEFVSAVQVVLTLPVGDCSMENRYVYYVLANQNALHDALEKSMQLRHESLYNEFSSFSGLVSSCSVIEQGVRCCARCMRERGDGGTEGQNARLD